MIADDINYLRFSKPACYYPVLRLHPDPPPQPTGRHPDPPEVRWADEDRLLGLPEVTEEVVPVCEEVAVGGGELTVQVPHLVLSCQSQSYLAILSHFKSENVYKDGINV